MSLAPQSEDEIRPIVEAMRRLDPLLDVRWNAEALVVKPGSYSELGKRIAPIYDGRWEVIRYDDARVGHTGFHPERGFSVICTVTEPVRDDHGVITLIALRDGGKYAPLGEWLVEYLHQWDGQNVAQLKTLRDRLWAESDRIEEAKGKLEEASAIEAMDHQHFLGNYRGGVGNWQGQGVDIAGMEKAAKERIDRAAARSILSH